MPNNGKLTERLQLRFDPESFANYQSMAAELNVPFNHFCTLAMGIGAKVLINQISAVKDTKIEDVPIEAWQAMAAGFSEKVDPDKWISAITKLAKEHPEDMKQLAAMFPDE